MGMGLLPLLLPVLAAAALGAAGRGGPGPVTCGSVVKLLNVRHNVRLHSHDVRYGSGSGQQSVTGVSAADDGNSYWRVRGRTAAVCQRGTPVRCGQAIRLTHLGTGRNLHSHRFASPLSGNQVPTADQPLRPGLSTFPLSLPLPSPLIAGSPESLLGLPWPC
ncbi:stromal cell derived factor 2 [Pitangus sulphuratus]|nr:stromal cell derived factor 2 [Pitangus sulphuratus]